MKLELELLKKEYAVCRADAPFPVPKGGEFLSITETAGEFSVVMEASAVPEGIRREGPWRAIKVCGALDFSLVGILADISGVLRDAGVSIFAVSTFDTDYILIKSEALDQAVQALTGAEYKLHL